MDSQSWLTSIELANQDDKSRELQKAEDTERQIFPLLTGTRAVTGEIPTAYN